jgi:hypothetical protein
MELFPIINIIYEMSMRLMSVKIRSDWLNIAQDIEEYSYVKGTGSQLDIRQNQKEVGRR